MHSSLSPAAISLIVAYGLGPERDALARVLVELALLEEDTEVLQDQRQDTRSHWNLFELRNGLRCAQNTPRRVGGNFCRLRILSSREKPAISLQAKVIGAWELRAAQEIEVRGQEPG